MNILQTLNLSITPIAILASKMLRGADTTNNIARTAKLV